MAMLMTIDGQLIAVRPSTARKHIALGDAPGLVRRLLMCLRRIDRLSTRGALQ